MTGLSTTGPLSTVFDGGQRDRREVLSVGCYELWISISVSSAGPVVVSVCFGSFGYIDSFGHVRYFGFFGSFVCLSCFARSD
ncbi:hypothetical protein [Streptomyces sp. x-80]|uniref:hypothetical protein n=1 Tax=Streptomyces sp. x-80 TaxID=2789282 RepID=UPI003980749C